MADAFEEGLKDLVSEQFKDNEPMPVRDEVTGKFASAKADEHDEEVGAREEAASDNEDGSRNDEEPDEDEEPEEPDEDDEEPEEPEEPAEDKGKAKGRTQKRIDGLTATVRRLERDLASVRATKEAEDASAAMPKRADGTKFDNGGDYAREQLRADPKAPKKPSPSAKDSDGKPLYKLGEFDEHYAEDRDDYLDARRRYLDAKEKEYDTLTSTPAPDAAAAQQQEFQTKLDATIESGKKSYKDFDAKVVKGIEQDAWPLSEAGAHFLVDSDVGADIAYHLASNVKLAKEIAELSPIAQIKRFTKIEDKFVADKATRKPKRASGAPEPIGKAKGGGGADSSRFDSENFEAVEQNWTKVNTKR